MHLPRLLSEAAPSHPSLGSSIPSRACVVWSSLIARPGLCVSRLCSCCAFALETFVQTQGPLGPSRQHFFFWEVLVVIVVVSHIQHAMVGRSLGHSLSFSRPLLPASLPQPWFQAAAFSHYHCIWTQMQASSGKLPQMGGRPCMSVSQQREFSFPLVILLPFYMAHVGILLLCICINVCVHTHILHTCTYTHTCAHTYYTHAHTHILHTLLHTYMYAHIYYTHILHTCTCTHIYTTHIHIHIHYIHVKHFFQTYIYTHRMILVCGEVNLDYLVYLSLIMSFFYNHTCLILI